MAIFESHARHGVAPRRTRRRSGERLGKRKPDNIRTDENIPQKPSIYNDFTNQYNDRMTSDDRAQQVEALLTRRLETVYPSVEAAKERLAGAERLTVYLGIDPTGTELHLGHTIPLLFLQDLFHGQRRKPLTVIHNSK